MKGVTGFVNDLCLFDLNVFRYSILNCRCIKIHNHWPLWPFQLINTFEILLVKIFTAKQKLHQIISATQKKIKSNIYFRVNVEISTVNSKTTPRGVY